MNRQIGVDFGTTTSAVGFQDTGSNLEMLSFNGKSHVPSLVLEEGTLTNKKGMEIHFDECFGWTAESKAKNNAYALLKSNFKMELLSKDEAQRKQAQKLTKKFFAYLFEEYQNKAVLTKNADQDSVSTVVTYPAKFPEDVQQFLKEAAEAAGFPSVQLLEESKAAMAFSLAYETQTIKKHVEGLHKNKLKVMIVDMGAGTTDIAIFAYDITDPSQFTLLCSWPENGGTNFGGREVDEILCEFYQEQLGMDLPSLLGGGNREQGKELLRWQIKNFKEETLSQMEAGDEISQLPGSLDMIPGRPDVDLTRETFEAVLKDYLPKFPEMVEAALKKANLTAKDLDMVLLTGGHSQWYFVQDMLAKQGIAKDTIFGFADPQLVVAKGAAIYTEPEEQEVEDESEDDLDLGYDPLPPWDNRALYPKRIGYSYYYGYVDDDGILRLPMEWEEAAYFHEGFAAVKRNGKWGLINRQGTLVVPCQYDWFRDFSDGCAAVELNDKWNFVDKNGKLLCSRWWDSAYSHSEGRAPVRSGDKWGFVDTNGDLIIDCEWDDVTAFENGRATAIKTQTKVSNSPLVTLSIHMMFPFRTLKRVDTYTIDRYGRTLDVQRGRWE